MGFSGCIGSGEATGWTLGAGVHDRAAGVVEGACRIHILDLDAVHGSRLSIFGRSTSRRSCSPLPPPTSRSPAGAPRPLLRARPGLELHQDEAAGAPLVSQGAPPLAATVPPALPTSWSTAVAAQDERPSTARQPWVPVQHRHRREAAGVAPVLVPAHRDPHASRPDPHGTGAGVSKVCGVGDWRRRWHAQAPVGSRVDGVHEGEG